MISVVLDAVAKNALQNVIVVLCKTDCVLSRVLFESHINIELQQMKRLLVGGPLYASVYLSRSRLSRLSAVLGNCIFPLSPDQWRTDDFTLGSRNLTTF